jgi:hypothetical protein
VVGGQPLIDDPDLARRERIGGRGEEEIDLPFRLRRRKREAVALGLARQRRTPLEQRKRPRSGNVVEVAQQHVRRRQSIEIPGQCVRLREPERIVADPVEVHVDHGDRSTAGEADVDRQRHTRLVAIGKPDGSGVENGVA